MQTGHDARIQVPPFPYNVVVEESPVDVDNTYPYAGRNDASTFRVRISTIMALAMAILGSSVVPVSYAFATTGVFCGLLISLVRYRHLPEPSSAKAGSSHIRPQWLISGFLRTDDQCKCRSLRIWR